MAFLHMFIWEQFGSILPKPVEYNEVEVHGEIIEKPDKPHQPRPIRWENVKQNKNKKLSKGIYIEKNFNFQLYPFTPRGICKLQLYDDNRANLHFMPRNAIPLKVQFWLVIIAPTLMPFKSQIMEGTVSYNLQRVLRQLGYDQGDHW